MSAHHDKPVEIDIKYNSEEQKIGAYADVSRMIVSPYTISFEFAQGIPPQGTLSNPLSDKPNIEAKMIMRIVMSPEHAKAFYDLFGENLKIYESTFGVIKSFEQKTESKE